MSSIYFSTVNVFGFYDVHFKILTFSVVTDSFCNNERAPSKINKCVLLVESCGAPEDQARACGEKNEN